MEGLVKIGKTTRDPKDRVDELSSSTGVPTPFILICQEYFEDCSIAERKIHQLLEEKNLRISNNREFFRMAPYEAILTVQNIKNRTISFSDEIIKENSEEITTTNIGDDLFNQALCYYFGKNDVIQDYKEAAILFKKATNLGNPNAYKYLGIIQWLGQGCRKNLAKGLEFIKKAINLGDNHSFALLSIMFVKAQGEYWEENANKSWNNFRQKLSVQFSHIDAIYLLQYIVTYKSFELEIPFIENLRPFKSQLIRYIDAFQDQFPYEENDEVRLIRENISPYILGEIGDFNNEIKVDDMLNHKHWGTCIYLGKTESGWKEEGRFFHEIKTHKNETILYPFDYDFSSFQLIVTSDKPRFYSEMKKIISTTL